MEYANLLLDSTARHLQKHFGQDELPYADNMPDLEHHVRLAVLYLLRHDLNRLLHILYRIDVDERDVKQAMKLPAEDQVAEQVARLIIKRELQKAQTRFIYRYN